MQKLKITNCKNHIEEFTLAGGSYTIGRSLDSTLRLEGEEVSRLHARLFVTANRCELMDDASKNGTFVNGNRITSYFLNDGDTIKIGRFNLKYISDNIKPEEKERKTRKGARYFFFTRPHISRIPFLSKYTHQKNLSPKNRPIPR